MLPTILKEHTGQRVCQFGAITEHQKWSGFYIKSLSHCSGGQESEIRGGQGWFVLGGLGREFQGLSYCQVIDGNIWYSLGVAASPHLGLHVFCVCALSSRFNPFYRDISYWSRLYIAPVWLHFDSICTNTLWLSSHSEILGTRFSTYEFGVRDTIQPITQICREPGSGVWFSDRAFVQAYTGPWVPCPALQIKLHIISMWLVRPNQPSSRVFLFVFVF